MRKWHRLLPVTSPDGQKWHRPVEGQKWHRPTLVDGQKW